MERGKRTLISGFVRGLARVNANDTKLMQAVTIELQDSITTTLDYGQAEEANKNRAKRISSRAKRGPFSDAGEEPGEALSRDNALSKDTSTINDHNRSGSDQKVKLADRLHLDAGQHGSVRIEDVGQATGRSHENEDAEDSNNEEEYNIDQQKTQAQALLKSLSAAEQSLD